ncbi:hypothetical protein J5X84_25980 [Streptosporangiaceae bacterium NEAU-GS5]|nr:hypothetical protein [Streptosporangiaceae bacterium NEAU-GS5]
MSAPATRFGAGPLSRVAAFVYTALVVEALFLLTALPGLAALVLLAPDPSNAPLAVACLLPVGPALSAALYAWGRRRADITDLWPAGTFLRGYRANLGGVLRLWIPLLAWLAITATILANFPAAGVPVWWGILLGLLAVAALLWAANALVITSLFAFRTADVARLAVYMLLHRPRVTLANACLLVVAAGVTFYASEVALALLAVVFAAMLLRGCRPMIAEIAEQFI